MVTEDPEDETARGTDVERTEESPDLIEKHVGRADGVHHRFGCQDIRVRRLIVEVVGHLDRWHGSMIRVLTIRCLTI